MPRYGLEQITPPAAEPIDLAAVKEFLRITDTDQDNRLRGLITAARARFEMQTGKQLVTAQWLLTMDWFWDIGATYVPGGPFVTGYVRNDEWRAWQERGGWGPLGLGMIRLPRNPVVSIDQVQYVDLQGVLQTADPSLYQFDTSRDVGRLAPAYGKVWPSTRAELEAVQITFTAGHGPVTTLSGAVAAAATTLTPASMQGIVNATDTGSVVSYVTLEPDTLYEETLGVTGANSINLMVDPTAFAHASGAVLSDVPRNLRVCLMQVVGAINEMRDRDLDKLDDMILRLIEVHASKTYA